MRVNDVEKIFIDIIYNHIRHIYIMYEKPPADLQRFNLNILKYKRKKERNSVK